MPPEAPRPRPPRSTPRRCPLEVREEGINNDGPSINNDFTMTIIVLLTMTIIVLTMTNTRCPPEVLEVPELPEVPLPTCFSHACATSLYRPCRRVCRQVCRRVRRRARQVRIVRVRIVRIRIVRVRAVLVPAVADQRSHKRSHKRSHGRLRLRLRLHLLSLWTLQYWTLRRLWFSQGEGA